MQKGSEEKKEGFTNVIRTGKFDPNGREIIDLQNDFCAISHEKYFAVLLEFFSIGFLLGLLQAEVEQKI